MDTIYIILGHENHPDRDIRVEPFFYSNQENAVQACERLNTATENSNRGHRLWHYTIHELTPNPL